VASRHDLPRRLLFGVDEETDLARVKMIAPEAAQG